MQFEHPRVPLPATMTLIEWVWSEDAGVKTPQGAENPSSAEPLQLSAKCTGPTDHWCHNPSRLVLALEHGAGKALLVQQASVASSARSMPKWVNTGRFFPKEAEGHSAGL